jgi:signal transduction histidine kinase
MQQDPQNLEQNTEYLELMAGAVGRIEATVRQLLDFSRPHEFVTTDVDLNRTVNKTVALIEYKATEKGIQIEKEFQEDMAAIPGDGHLLEQLTLNLALNAIDAMQYGGTLRFQTGSTVSENLPGGSGVYLKVIDTGIGMTEAARQHIFEMFYTTSETGEGLGLGLAVSDWIVKQHRGIIEVESESGKGSTFCVKFPLIKNKEGGTLEARI